MAALVGLLSLVVILLAVLVAGLLRSHAEILRSLHDLGVHEAADIDRRGRSRPARPRSRPLGDATPPGERTAPATAASIAGVSPTGAALAVTVAGRPGTTLLAFLSSTCLTCRDFFEAFGRPGFAVPGGARLVVVTKGPDDETPSLLEQLAPSNVTVVMSSEAFEAFGVPVAPYFLLVDGPSGDVVGEGAAATWDQLCDLLGRASADNGWAEAMSFRSRLARADGELRRAGVEPGHPTLHPAGETEGES